MSAASPEFPQFDPQADYQATLDAFRITFAAGACDGTIFDAGHGVRLLSGDMAVTNATSLWEDADTLHLVLVEVRDEKEVTSYRFFARHLNNDGTDLGEPFVKTYFRDFTETHLQNHHEDDGELVRDWLAGAQFAFWKASVDASAQVHTSAVLEAQIAEDHAIAQARAVFRRRRIEKVLGWFAPLYPFFGLPPEKS